jgi:hypothetical protein
MYCNPFTRPICAARYRQLCSYSSTPSFFWVSLQMAQSKNQRENKADFANLDLVNESRQWAFIQHLAALVESTVSASEKERIVI